MVATLVLPTAILALLVQRCVLRDLKPEFDFAVIHDPCPNDWIDLFVPHRPLKPMTEVVPSTNLDADCFSSGMQMATAAGLIGVPYWFFWRTGRLSSDADTVVSCCTHATTRLMMPGADFHQKKGSLGFGCKVKLCWALGTMSAV